MTILNNDTHWSKPGDFLSVWVRYKHGIHVNLPIGDEIENKAMFSLYSVTEKFTTGKNYAEMGIVPHAINAWV